MTTRTKRYVLRLFVALVALVALSSVAWYARDDGTSCCVQRLSLEWVRLENARYRADSVRPADFALVVAHGTGSLAPEYHYDYEVRLSPGGSAELRYWPGYGHVDSLLTRESFTVGAATLDSLWHLAAPLREAPGTRSQRDIPDGGGSPTLTIVSKGETRVVQAWQPEPWGEQQHAVAALIRRAIPSDVWARCEAAQARFGRARTEQTRAQRA